VKSDPLKTTIRVKIVTRGKQICSGWGHDRADESFSAVAEGFRDFNVRLMEMELNTVAALDFAREMSSAKRPADAAALWSSHAQKQFETLTEQSKELTALAQRIANSSAAPMTRSFGHALKGTA
jgi:hypothetical protein